MGKRPRQIPDVLPSPERAGNELSVSEEVPAGKGKIKSSKPAYRWELGLRSVARARELGASEGETSSVNAAVRWLRARPEHKQDGSFLAPNESPLQGGGRGNWSLGQHTAERKAVAEAPADHVVYEDWSGNAKYQNYPAIGPWGEKRSVADQRGYIVSGEVPLSRSTEGHTSYSTSGAGGRSGSHQNEYAFGWSEEDRIELSRLYPPTQGGIPWGPIYRRTSAYRPEVKKYGPSVATYQGARGTQDLPVHLSMQFQNSSFRSPT